MKGNVLGTVPVKINDQCNFFPPHNALNLCLNCSYFRMLFGFIEVPRTIEVKPMKIASVIANNNSINIDHRKYIEIKTGEQKLALLRSSKQFLNDCLKHMR